MRRSAVAPGLIRIQKPARRRVLFPRRAAWANPVCARRCALRLAALRREAAREQAQIRMVAARCCVSIRTRRSMATPACAPPAEESWSGSGTNPVPLQMVAADRHALLPGELAAVPARAPPGPGLWSEAPSRSHPTQTSAAQPRALVLPRAMARSCCGKAPAEAVLRRVAAPYSIPVRTAEAQRRDVDRLTKPSAFRADTRPAAQPSAVAPDSVAARSLPAQPCAWARQQPAAEVQANDRSAPGR